MVGNSTKTGPRLTRAPRSHLADATDLIVARLVSELSLAESFQQWRQVHAEAAAIALPKPVPAADRVVFGAAPRLDGAFLRGLLLIRGAEVDPVTLLEEPRVQILDTSELVSQLS